ncbi:hypothetical protein OAA91_01215 [Fibrobacterales bacterium]|nr:hypothetical protein [Fibrobacterales bacterium]
MDENLKSYLLSLLKEVNFVKIKLLSLAGMGGMLGFILSFLVLPDFTSKETLSLQDEETFNSLLDGLVAPVNSENAIISGKAFLYSKETLLKIAKDASWIDSNSSNTLKNSMINKISNSAKIENTPRQKDVFEISFTHKQAKLAQKMTHLVAKAFVRETQNRRKKTASLALEFLEAKNKSVLINLDTIKSQKRNFKESNMLSLPNNYLPGTKNLVDMQRELVNSRSDLKETEQRIKLLRESYKKYNPHKINWLKKLQNIEMEIKERSAYLTSKHPKMLSLMHIKLNIKTQIKLIDDNSTRELYLPSGKLSLGGDGKPILEGGNSSDIFWMGRRMQEQELILKKEELQAKISQFDTLLLNLKVHIDDIPRIEEKLQSFDNEIERLNKRYTDISKKISDARHSIEITVLDAKSGYSVLSPAYLPMVPDSPLKLKFSILGFILTLLFPIILIAIKEYFRNRVTDLSSLQRLSPNTPVSALPKMEE